MIRVLFVVFVLAWMVVGAFAPISNLDWTLGLAIIALGFGVAHLAANLVANHRRKQRQY